jgi:transposase
VVRGSARQAAIASSVNQIVKLPRWRRAASYSDQFVTRCCCFGMSRQTIWRSPSSWKVIAGRRPRGLRHGSADARDWVIRYNEQGIAGLSDRPHGGGASPKLSVEEKAQLAAWVRQGSDIAEDGVVRWRLRDLRDQILARFFLPMHERSVRRLLKTLMFSHISARPRHPQADAAAQEVHKKTSPTWLLPSFPLPHKASRSSCGGRTRLVLVNKAA